MQFRHGNLLCAFLFLLHSPFSASATEAESPSLLLPKPGTYQLRCISPDILELSLVTLKQPDPAQMSEWDFADNEGHLHLPGVKEFSVKAGGSNVAVRAIGFKRRV